MKKISGAPIIFRTGWFDSCFAEFVFSDELKHLEWHNLFVEPRYRVSDTESTYRSINYWDEQGLLLSKRSSTDSWRQFSILDVVWMRVLQALKRVGMQSDVLLTLKEHIFVVKDSVGRYSELEFWVYASLQNKDVSLVVFPDGRGVIATPQDIELHQIVHGLGETYITINFKQIVLSILKPENEKSGRRTEPLLKFEKEEIELISTVRLENVDTVTAHLKEGKLERIEMRKVEQNPELLMEMVRQKLKESPNQTITIKKQDGKVVFVEHQKSKSVKRVR